MSNPEIRPGPPVGLDTVRALLWLLDRNGCQVEFGAGFDPDAGRPGYTVAVNDSAGERRIIRGSDPVVVLTELAQQLGFEDMDDDSPTAGQGAFWPADLYHPPKGTGAKCGRG